MNVSNINETDDKITCPKCGSSQIFIGKKGYSGKKACCGTLLAGPIGLLCGTHKSNKLIKTCVKCNHSW